jgi:hypothetical protein
MSVFGSQLSHVSASVCISLCLCLTFFPSSFLNCHPFSLPSLISVSSSYYSLSHSLSFLIYLLLNPILSLHLNFSQLAILCTDHVSVLNVPHLDATVCALAHSRFLSTRTKRTMFCFVPCSAVGLLENEQKTNNLSVRDFGSFSAWNYRKVINVASRTSMAGGLGRQLRPEFLTRSFHLLPYHSKSISYCLTKGLDFLLSCFTLSSLCVEGTEHLQLM